MSSNIPTGVFSRLPSLLHCALPGAGWLACWLLCALVTQARLVAQAREFGIEVHGISNGASFKSATLKQGIAPGSIFVISGQHLGPQELVVAPTPYPVQLPAETGGTRVAFHNSETAAVFDAPLIHTSFRQVAGIVPPALPAGRYTVAVSYLRESAESEPFLVTASSPGLFATSMMGFGPGVAQNFESPESIPLNRLTQPALPGGHLIVWGTGLGSADSANLSAGMFRQDVWVEIGGVRMRPSYAGPAPGFPGLDQINVPLPTEELAAGCYVPLQVIANGVARNTVTVSLSETPGTCAHPMGFSTETLKHLDEGGTVVLGSVNLRRTANFESQLIPGLGNGAAFVSAQFYRANAQLVFLNSGTAIARNGCNVPSAFRGGGIFSSQWIDAPTFQTPIQAIDAGPSLMATGPSGQTLELVRQQYDFGPAGSYSIPDATPGEVLRAGVWKIKGTGGADVGAFEATVTMLPRRTVDFPEIIRLDEPLEITWPATDLDDRHTAHVGLSVAIPVGVPTAQGDFSVTHGFFLGFSCAVPAGEGRLTVPADILQGRLPSENEATHSVSLGIDAPPVVFTAPGMDYGTARAGVSESRAVTVE